MINELLFFGHITAVSLATLYFARLGKEALVSYIALLFVMANIFVIKQITLFSWCATSADAFIIGISFGLNILQEFWGKQIARKAIWISFACSLIYTGMAQWILLYHPTTCDTTQLHLLAINLHAPRIIAASCIAYLITQYIDTQLYYFLKLKTGGAYFTVRNYISICFSQLCDTILFSYLGLYGIMPNITNIIFVSYVIKIIALFIMTPWLMFAKKIINSK